jgi:parallel beta-helix repeat protein
MKCRYTLFLLLAMGLLCAILPGELMSQEKENEKTLAEEWTDVDLPMGEGYIEDLVFTDENNGWAVGIDHTDNMAQILKTTDGGATWTVNSEPGMGSINFIYFVDDNQAYAGGQNYNNGNIWILKSTNGGASWQEETVPEVSGSLNAFSTDGNTMVAVGNKFDEGLYPLAIRNSGSGWESASTPADKAWLMDVHFSGGDGWAVGSYMENSQPLLLHSDNSGQSWGTVGNLPLNEGEFMTVTSRDGTLFIGGGDADGPLLMLSTNSGTDWTLEDLPQGGIIDSGDIKNDKMLGNITIKIAAIHFYIKWYMLVAVFSGDNPSFYIVTRDQDGEYSTVGTQQEGEPGGALVTVGQGGGGGNKKPNVKVPIKKGGKNKITTIVDEPSDEMKILAISISPATAVEDGCYATGNGTYQYLSIATATAYENADNGWNFDKWTGDLSGKAKTTTVTMDADKIGTANFKLVKLEVGAIEFDENYEYYSCPDVLSEIQLSKFYLMANENDSWKVDKINFNIEACSAIDFENTLIRGELSVGSKLYTATVENYLNGVLTFNLNGHTIAPSQKEICMFSLFFDVDLIELTPEYPGGEFNFSLKAGDIIAAPVVWKNSIIEYIDKGLLNGLIIGKIITLSDRGVECFLEFNELFPDDKPQTYTDIYLCSGEYGNIPNISSSAALGLNIKSISETESTIIQDNMHVFAKSLSIKDLSFDIDNSSPALNVTLEEGECRINNCIFKSKDGIGIANGREGLEDDNLGRKFYISGNKFFDHHSAIVLSHYADVNISDNEFSGFTYGIYIDNNVWDAKISKNNFLNCAATNKGSAIHINQYDDLGRYHFIGGKWISPIIEISNNYFNFGFNDPYFSGNKEICGVYVNNNTPLHIVGFEDHSRTITINIMNNSFMKCHYGIILNDSRYLEINNNKFFYNYIGLLVNEKASNPRVIGNDFLFNRVAGIKYYLFDPDYSRNSIYVSMNKIEENGVVPYKGLIDLGKGNKALSSSDLYGGIILDNSSVQLSKNRIHSDSSAGILLINDSRCIVRNSSFSDNFEYAINAEEGSEADARNNWWGDPSGPSGEGPGSGDAVSANVIYSDFLDKELGAASFFSSDTLFVPVGTTDSLDLLYRNFIVDDDSFDITISESQDWITSAKSFNTGNLDSTCHSSYVYFTTPAEASDDIVNRIIQQAVSVANNSDTDQDTTYILCYEPHLDKIFTNDTTFVVQADTAWLAAWGWDQYSNSFSIDPDWAVSGGGTIDGDGMFVSDGTIGIFEVTVEQDGTTSNGFISVLDSTVSVYEYEVSPDFISLRPNPVKELTVLEIRKQVMQDISLMFVDLHGNRLNLEMQEQVSNDIRRYSINTSSLTSGVYFIKIIMDGRRYSVKMIKAN